MTESTNLDLVRSIYADWERGDFRRVDWARHDIQYTDVDGLSPGRVTGLKAMAARWRDFVTDWGDFRAEAEGYRELDDERVLVWHRFSGRGKTSGVEVGPTGAKGACLFHVGDGKVTKLLLYSDRDRALADLGPTLEEGDTP
jgi:ketosteroid isomerase-like protein